MESLSVHPPQSPGFTTPNYTGGWYCDRCGAYVVWGQDHNCLNATSAQPTPQPMSVSVIVDQTYLQTLEKRIAELERKLAGKKENN